MPAKPSVGLISENVEALEKLYGRMTACHVVVQVPDRHHRTASSPSTFTSACRAAST